MGTATDHESGNTTFILGLIMLIIAAACLALSSFALVQARETRVHPHKHHKAAHKVARHAATRVKHPHKQPAKAKHKSHPVTRVQHHRAKKGTGKKTTHPAAIKAGHHPRPPTVKHVAPPRSHPQPSPTQQVIAAMTQFSHALKHSAQTTSCNGMNRYATGMALSQEFTVCTNDHATNVHKEITDLSPPVIDSVFISPDGTSATVTVTKHQSYLFYFNACGVPDDQDRCGNPGKPNTQRDMTYVVTYTLVRVGNRWLVSDFATT